MSINPTQQNIMEVFSANRQYYIDFYQRDYQWKTAQMERLLEDLFYRFSLEYDPDIDPTSERISQFDWYYLNAYVTNEYRGKTFIVDGQQRLTSITLILIKLYHMAREMSPDRRDLLKEQIRGAGLDGPTYWMGQDHRRLALEDLFTNGEKELEIADDDLSLNNIYKNFEVADKKLQSFLTNGHRFESFVLYFLTRVMLVRIQIQNTKDVPMVFEVINDRGVRLLPYEVLKGKLLGQINKDQIDPYHDIWQEHVHELQRIDESEVDTFFRFYFRAKHVDTRTEYREFDGEYHKTIYEEKWAKKIQLKQNPNEVKNFITRELRYYANLYARILRDAETEQTSISDHLFFNNLNNQDRQFLLILSACSINDPEETQKIRLVSRLFDRHFTLLQLTGAYDSNQFTESLIALNKNLRDKKLAEIAMVYNDQILSDISEGLGVEVKDPFDWRYFKDATMRNMGKTFLKYYFARIDHFIADQINKETESYETLVKKSGWKWGYHIEHILAYNEENLELFDGDEELFYAERNRLGALLLLLGRDNQASQNEPYAGKLKTYSHSLLWNRTLHEDFYHRNKNFEDLMQNYQLDFKPIATFDQDAIDQRQKLLCQMTRLIWQPWNSSDVDSSPAAESIPESI